MPPKPKGKPEKPVKQVVRVHQNKKKHKPPEHENGERWLLTYADMITLLLALFIILFAISKPPSKIVYDRLAKELSGGFGGTSAVTLPVHGPSRGMVSKQTENKDESTAQSAASSSSQSQSQSQSKSQSRSQAQSQSQSQAQAQAKAQDAKMKQLAKQLRETVKKLKMEKRVVITRTGRGIVISLLTDHASFDSGSAILRPGAAELLHAIGPFLTRINNEIRVEGNTDNVPIHTPEYPTNWELSAARAVTVTRHLVEHEHLSPERASAAGFGEFKPQTDNLTEAHRQLNRRVDIVILNTRIVNTSNDEGTADSDAPPSEQ